MTKSKKKSKAVVRTSMVGGSEVTSKRVYKRAFLPEVFPTAISSVVLSKSQSPCEVGSAFAAGSLTFKATDLDTGATSWIQKFDAFRIKEVEVHAYMSYKSRRDNPATGAASPVILYVAEDMDCTSNTTVNWSKLRNRSNIRRVVFTSTNLHKKIAHIRPRPTFTPASSGVSTMIPSNDTWLDATALGQEYAGLEIFAACPIPSTGEVSGDYAFIITFEVRMLIETKGAI